MSQAADRNLLFGILALQNDFITRDQLIEALNAWVIAKERPLGDLLRERGALGEPEYALLEAILARQLARHNGDAVQSLQALSSVSSVRQALASVADPDVQASLAVAGTANAKADPYATKPPDPNEVLPNVRYRILRPHARGGLGEVFVAEDTELHREIALKEIQSQHAGNLDSRGRFLLEAEITGKLEHPGIVPVYGLGSYSDGRPFYAMRFIKGDNLKDAIERFHQSNERFDSLAFRQLLRRFLDVCNAVAYAHSRGVLHRDLKPGNVMLGKYGETLVVDWGLAKVVGRKESAGASATDADEATLKALLGSGSAETVDGMAIGTPSFMSPEQAEGNLDALGPATDVYSLGATLYCLLTKQAPVQGGDVSVVLRKVRRAEIVPVRQVHGDVPKALDAICRKAMALRPAQRYASALDLAADVEHWLADEPVTAYREPLLAQAARWARKHRTLVSSMGAVLLVSLVGLVIGLLMLSGLNHRLDKANQDLTDSNKRLETANGELEDMLTAIQSGKWESDGKWNNPFSLYELALEKQKARLGSDHPDTIRSMNDLARRYEEADQRNRALPLYEQALEKQRSRLGADHPDTLRAMNHLALEYDMAGRLDQALLLCELTLEKRKTLLGADHPDTLISMSNLAYMYHQAGKLDQALPLYEQALEKRRAKLGADNAETLRSMEGLALLYLDMKRLAEAETLLIEALAASRKPQTGLWPVKTVTVLEKLGNCQIQLKKYAQAEKTLRELVEQYERSPLDRLRWQYFQPQSLLGEALLEQMKFAEAEPLLKASYEGLKAKQEESRYPWELREVAPKVLAALDRLIRLYNAWNKPVEAGRLQTERLQIERLQIEREVGKIAR